MADLLEQIEDLLAEAEDLDYGPTRLAMTERAVELADSHNDVDVAFEARMQLVGAATFSGRSDIAMVAYSWLLTKYDENPDNYNEFEILWRYKWILENVADFPNISKAQIDALFEDMKRRYEAAGSTLHSYWGIRRNNAFIMEDVDEAKTAAKMLAKIPRDHLSNCLACVQDEEVEYCVFISDDAGALRAAAPILKGTMKCGEVPERTYAGIMLPLIRLGRHAEALAYYKTGYRLVRGNAKFVRHKAMFMIGLTLTGNRDRAVKMLDRHLSEAVESASPWWQFEFYLAARLLMEKLTQTGQNALPIRLPKLPGWQGLDDEPTVAEFTEWLDGRVHDLATHFDDRNGTKNYSKRVSNFRDLFQFEKVCPLK